MVSHSLSRTIVYLATAVLAPLFLTQCKTAAKSYKDVSYDPAKLKTPAGHGLDRNDYPFDESGAYRKDWVKSNTGGRDRSASPQVGATTAVAAADTSAPSSAPTSYPTYAEASAARSSGSYIGPAGDTAGSGVPNGGSVVPNGGSGVELASAGSSSAASTTAPAAPAAPAGTSYHKVGSGDTLFALASKYHTSVPELKRVNGLSGDSIRAGQSLRIP
jgi:LysM repeat protein